MIRPSAHQRRAFSSCRSSRRRARGLARRLRAASWTSSATAAARSASDGDPVAPGVERADAAECHARTHDEGDSDDRRRPQGDDCEAAEAQGYPAGQPDECENPRLRRIDDGRVHRHEDAQRSVVGVLSVGEGDQGSQIPGDGHGNRCLEREHEPGGGENLAAGGADSAREAAPSRDGGISGHTVTVTALTWTNGGG